MSREPFRKFPRLRLPTRLSVVSWRDLAITVAPIVLVTILAIWLAFHYVRPAPPDTIVFTSGPDGSSFRTFAERYQKILARNRVKLEILPSGGSLENLRRLADPKFKVDVGFVQGGVAEGTNLENLVSLGSVFNQTLAIFYRSDARVERLAHFAGKRLAIGHEGSGTRFLSLALLKANAIEPGGPTELVALAGADAADALLAGRVDAAFLMGDSAAPPIMRKLLNAPGIQLFDFTQAEAYVRRFRYLNRLELPMGAIDFGRNLPDHTLQLVGPTTELVARSDLHPALSDLLIDAAREVHGRATLLQKAGEFPAPTEHEFRMSEDAVRYYKSGKGFFYRHLPFWLATLVDRVIVIIVPIIVLLIPGLRIVPALYRWRVMSRIYRCYGALIALERDTYADTDGTRRQELLARLDEIERTVARVKVPLLFAEQFYVLRQHIDFVRARLAAM